MKKIRSRCKAACLVAFVLLFLSAGSVRSYAAETKSGSENTTITVASNVSEQEMEPYLNAFRQKYPGIQVDYTCYSDYENEIGSRSRLVITRMFCSSRDRFHPRIMRIILSRSERKRILAKNMITCRAAKSLKIRYTGSRHPHM